MKGIYKLLSSRVAITANRSDTEPHRLHRLVRAKEHIFVCDPRTLGKLASLHDHKGVLTVFWRDNPDSYDRLLLSEIWKELDGADTIQHEVVGTTFDVRDK